MSRAIQKEADNIVSQMATGELEGLASRFSFPSVVYVGDKVMVLENAARLLEALELYRSILAEASLAVITTTVVASESLERGQSRFTVKNKYYATDGKDLGTGRLNYFCREIEGFKKIQMVEYLEWPCAEQVMSNQAFQRILA